MFIQRKSHLRKLSRVRVSEGRDLDNGLRLDRNEKVDVWPTQIMSEIFLCKPDWFLSVYPDSRTLYQKLAKHHGVDESEIFLSAGIDGGLKVLYEIMTEPSDLIGVVSPTYAMYQVYAKMFELQLEEIAYTDALEFGFQQFDEFLEQRPTMFFLPNPNQPIESCFDVQALEEFAQKTLASNCMLIIDEAYHMFGSESAVDLVRKYENVVIARTFSKGFGVPSIRFGYFISNQDNMNVLAKTRFAHESNALSNAVAEYLLDNYPIVEKYNEAVVSARKELKIILAAFGITARGDFGNFLLLDLESEERARNYVCFLRDLKIYIKGPWSGRFSRYVTITLGPLELMMKFVDATQTFCLLKKQLL